jgi:acetyl-CoA acetyltransferase family protein
MRALREAVLVGYARTPFGKADPKRGCFRHVRSDDLAVAVLRELLHRTEVSTADIDGVFLGAVEMMGEQAHPGTAIPFLAGFPPHVVGMSVERACTTAMMAVHIAAMNIQCGQGDLYIAGGLDSMTHFRIPVIKEGMAMDEVIRQSGTLLSAMNPNPKMAEMVNLIDLNGGQAAERLCEQFDISRTEMDAWALRSHQRAVAAQQAGVFGDEIVPVEGIRADGTTALIEHDQGPRGDTSIEKIAGLAPVYRPDGRITAATASGQADGAAACLIASRERAATLGLPPLARLRTIATGACAPTDLVYSAIPATRKALQLSGLSMADFQLIEVNEAFACAPIALMREFKLSERDADKINVNGGAIAIGHPVGASGARLIGTLALELGRRGGGLGLATICGGMGQGASTILAVDS